jgi:hypothetical protein
MSARLARGEQAQRTSPNAISGETADLIVRLRKELADQGLDAGPESIRWHLEYHHQVTVSPATIVQYLSARGLVVPEPRKRPQSSYIRFQADQPNECWQSDFTPSQCRQRHGRHHPVLRRQGRPRTARKPSCATWVSPRRTASRTTRKPSAESNDSSRTRACGGSRSSSRYNTRSGHWRFRSRPPGRARERSPRAWLAAAVYLDAASGVFAESSWMPSPRQSQKATAHGMLSK